MAVAFDNCTSGGTNATSLVFDHTCSGDDRCLVVFVAIDAPVDFNPSASYNGVSMTMLTEVTTERYIAVFILANPASGTNSVSITGLPGGGREHAFAISFTGVDQSTPNDTPDTISAGTANPSHSVLSATGDMVVASIAVNTSTAPTSNQTIPTNGILEDAAMSGAVAYAAGAASVSMEWTIAAVSHSGIALNLNAAGSSGGTINTQTLSSEIGVSDESASLWLLRNRLLGDAITVSEGDFIQSTLHSVLAEDQLSVTDQIIRWARRNRLLQEEIAVTDSAITNIIGYLIFIEVLTSSVSVTDESIVYRLFDRMLDSHALIDDQALKALSVTRELLSTLNVSDEAQTAMQRFILLTDVLSLDDSISSLVTTPTTSNPIIVIGFDQPRIEIGGYVL